METVPRWHRLEADARREQILDCAVRLFGERPYAAVSTTEIAREAGVARGLLNHYFGTKRELYLAVVRRLVRLPDFDASIVTTGSLMDRVEGSVGWFLDAVSAHGKVFVAISGPEGMGADPEVEKIVAASDDRTARAVLTALGVDPAEHVAAHRAVLRVYAGLVKAAVREWIRDGTLTREQVQLLLSRALLAIVRDVLPGIHD